jgi:hypothetical protein
MSFDPQSPTNSMLPGNQPQQPFLSPRESTSPMASSPASNPAALGVSTPFNFNIQSPNGMPMGMPAGMPVSPGLPSPGVDPFSLGQSFQHPFVPQDLWQMPMTLEWDWADMTRDTNGTL